jgi:hypothetical protein
MIGANGRTTCAVHIQDLLGLWCLTSLSIIFQLFRGGQFSWCTWRIPLTCRKSLTNFITYCCIEYTPPINFIYILDIYYEKSCLWLVRMDGLHVQYTFKIWNYKYCKGRDRMVVGLTTMMFNVTFNNISVISWRSVFLVYLENTTDLSQVTDKLYPNLKKESRFLHCNNTQESEMLLIRKHQSV